MSPDEKIADLIERVDMEFLVENGEIGDCVRACTATVFGVPRETVPHFVREHRGDWRHPWTDWIEERGFVVVETDPRIRPDCLFLACGPTPRTKEYRPAAHMVVMHGIETIHDPHPSRAGLTTVDRVYLLIPALPPAALRLAASSGWQPMDSAPRDGTVVDLWCSSPGISAGPGRVPDCWFSAGKWWRYDEQYGDDQCRSEVHNATHYTPSPPGPDTSHA